MYFFPVIKAEFSASCDQSWIFSISLQCHMILQKSL